MNSIPTVTKNLLIINILAFIAYYVLAGRGIDLNDMFGLHIFLASDFHIYQFITYMFMHGGWTHLFFNMFALWMFGCVMERTWGPKKFLFYYIFCGIGAGVVQEIAQYVEVYNYVDNVGFFEMAFAKWDAGSMANLNAMTTVGASGAIYAILLGFGMTFPEERIFIFPLPLPIKAKWFVIGYAAIEVIMAYSSFNDGVAHIAHLGGMLFGFILIKYWQKHPYVGSNYGRSSGEQFFKRFRNWGKKGNSADDMRRKTDWDYNADKKATEEEIDRILDKIRKNGYASLTEEEKKRLFDYSNRK